MRRTVFYPVHAGAAGAAASLLADEFDMRKLGPDEVVASTVPLVFLADADGPDRPPGPNVRVIGLVDPRRPGTWPEHWYGLLPAYPGRAILVRAIANAFADLDAAEEIARLGRELSELNAIGIRLSAERSPAALLEVILTKAREITNSDAGSLYLVEHEADGNARLFFALAQNDSLEVPFRATTLPLSRTSVAGYVALTGAPVNLADAYTPPEGSPFSINRSFDEQTGYRTKSMLVVPMRTPQGETIGVLQLINCKPGAGGRLVDADDVALRVQPFGARYETLAGSLASQAAVALANSRLFQNVRQLFEGFVGAAVTAIESRDPTTSGHSFRVSELTVGLAEAVDRCEQGPYATARFTTDELMELRYAALLHDFGKVGVREHVLLKAKKLYPGELDRIRQRVALIKRGLELKYTGKKLETLLARGRRGFDRQAKAIDAELAAFLGELDDHLDRIVMANEPSVLPSDVVEHLRGLALQTFEDHLGNHQAVITSEEARILAIPRGSLTDTEMDEMRSHVVHTWEFLKRIPWTKEFRRIPEIARAHHEKLDGSGYPLGMKAPDIPLQSKIMAIADIYDALTAADRPYKKAVPLEQALDILDGERRMGTLDGELFDLFVTARIFDRTRPR